MGDTPPTVAYSVQAMTKDKKKKKKAKAEENVRILCPVPNI
jgi:hypothetical protein